MSIDAFYELGVECDAWFIRLGVAVHDSGKILFVQELDKPGAMHEAAGRDLLIKSGVQPKIADCCISHADWQAPGRSFEELVVALSDKLWKGKREEQLELLVIDAAAAKLDRTRWDVFVTLDAAFERVAAGAIERLCRS